MHNTKWLDMYTHAVACKGGADGATAPGIHPGGIQGASFIKNCR